LTTFGPVLVPDELRDAVSDRAWLAAMVDAERALANASALAGVVPAAAAAAIADACEPERFDLDIILAEGAAVANPAEPLVRALRGMVADDLARWVHFGATSQDVVDSAAMLVARDTVELILEELAGAGDACAALAERHRTDPAPARTLLQQAVPTTFGAKAAVWLAGFADARDALRSLDFPAQLGGAAGTLAAFGERAPEVVAAFAAELDLAEPAVPWHTQRTPVAAIASALEACGRASAKAALDVVLLAQTEVGEVAEAGGGGSSTMPHKQNSTRAVRARACARIVHANASLLASGDYEGERSAGAWQAEWTALSEALAHAGGAIAASRECLESLTVDVARMRANLSSQLYSERDRLGLDDPDYLGSAPALVDRAVARWRSA
jgi:3-carboxy-cis,cis-muconate cycloisomerase